MFAVIQTGGKQVRVEQGDKIKVEKLSGNEGDSIVFDQVLLTADGSKVEIGKPLLNTGVSAKILNHGKNKKITVFKFKAKKRYQKKQGHRQQYTEVEIVKIGVAKPKKEAEAAVKKEEKPVAEKKETTKATSKRKMPAKKTTVAKKPAAKKASAKRPAIKKAPAKKKAE